MADKEQAAAQPAPEQAPQMQITAEVLAQALHAKQAPVMPAVGLDEAPEGGQVFLTPDGRRVDAWGNEKK
jgi:hypothetical protein